jgi:hypothetical protein
MEYNTIGTCSLKFNGSGSFTVKYYIYIYVQELPFESILSKISVYAFSLWAQEGGRPWSEEVSLYRVTDLEGKLKGHVYLDPYIR